MFDTAPPAGRSWRIAHLSDLHTVGERFGFRIESGRSGPRGNDRLCRILARLDAIHAAQPLDLVLITGDITDAGRSSEWAEFLTAMEKYPELSRRTLLLPGNHDINVVDRANPARLDLPISPGKSLRSMRALSALEALQGDGVRVVDATTGDLGGTLSNELAPEYAAIAAFADSGTRRLSARLAQVWSGAFPMILPPETPNGLGVILLNSNADAHFSFTNALGLVSTDQMRAIATVTRRLSRAAWIVAMHGHRHVDWIGDCGGVRIISAPSPVMEVTDDEPTCFHIHTLAIGCDGRLRLLRPERIEIPGDGAKSDVKAQP